MALALRYALLRPAETRADSLRPGCSTQCVDPGQASKPSRALTRVLLIETLRDFSGIGLLISHDRALLDELAVSCLCFEGDGMEIWPGNYSAVQEQEMQEHDTSLHAREAARTEYRRLAQEQQRRREEADRSAAKRSRRNLDPHDHDSREKIGCAIVSGKNRKAADKVCQLDQRMQGLGKKAGAAVA